MAMNLRDLATLALCGLVLGVLLGILVAGAYATWVVGGDVSAIGFGTILAFAPDEIGALGEPFRTAVILGSGVAAILTVAAPVLGFRKVLTSHGSARWARPGELARQGMTVRIRAGKGGLVGPILGKLGGPRSRKPFLTSQNTPDARDAIPHCLVNGPSGAGKGVGIVIPTLLTYWGSVIVLDPKGENFAKTARRRRAMGDVVYRFDPYAADGRTHRYNPLDYVAEAPPQERLKEAKRVAASLITIGGNGQNFLGGARDIFAATALVMVHRETPAIAAIYDALTREGGSFKALAMMAEEAREAGMADAAGLLRQYAGYEAKVLSSYMSVLFEGGLGLWADPTVRVATAATDFRVEEMRRRGTSVYVTVSPNDLEPLAPLVRVLFQQAIGVLQQREPVKRARSGMRDRLRWPRKSKPKETTEPFPVLFLMDEFVSLGRLDILIRALTTLRGFGGRVMIVIQSIASVRKIYGRDGADELLGLCGIQIFMSPSDKETPEYISASIGKFTRASRSTQWSSNELTSSYSEKEEGFDLMRPEQVRMIGNRRIIALIENSNPVLAHRVTYFEDRVLRRIYSQQAGDPPVPGVPAKPEPAEARVPASETHDVDATPSSADVRGEAETDGSTVTKAPPETSAATDHDPSPSTADRAPPEADEPVGRHDQHGSERPLDKTDPEELPAERDRTYQKQLRHVTVAQSHLHEEILAQLAERRISPEAKGAAAKADRDGDQPRNHGSPTSPLPFRTNLSAGPADLSALAKARAQVSGSCAPRSGTDD